MPGPEARIGMLGWPWGGNKPESPPDGRPAGLQTGAGPRTVPLSRHSAVVTIDKPTPEAPGQARRRTLCTGHRCASGAGASTEILDPPGRLHRPSCAATASRLRWPPARVGSSLDPRFHSCARGRCLRAGPRRRCPLSRGRPVAPYCASWPLRALRLPVLQRSPSRDPGLSAPGRIRPCDPRLRRRTQTVRRRPSPRIRGTEGKCVHVAPGALRRLLNPAAQPARTPVASRRPRRRSSTSRRP